MLERVYEWKGLNVLEVHYVTDIHYYLESKNLKNIDVIKLYQVGKNYNNKLIEFTTLHIDLQMSEEEIFKSFHSNTRNEIRKNLKSDEIIYDVNDSPSENDIKVFFNDLNIFMQQKNHKIDNTFLLQQTEDFKSSIVITNVRKDGALLASHLYLVDESRARYKSGISYRLAEDIDPKIVGRSNRGLHWYDMQFFKNKGINIYDLGGITVNTTDQAKINITKFKERFSKNHVIEFEGNIGVSLKGKLALGINNIKKKL